MKEADLYAPVKDLLEGQGYTVKGEITECDLVALRGDEAPVIVELKTSFTLSLVMQGVARQAISDWVYVAVPPIKGRKKIQQVMGLCKRLGLGLMTVRLEPSAFVEVALDPAPYQPRQKARRKSRLLREFARRVGDPMAGGSTRARPGMTAYRQDALRCAAFLKAGPARARDVASKTGVAKARDLLYRDVYGWFERVSTGVYALTSKGTQALDTWTDEISKLD